MDFSQILQTLSAFIFVLGLMFITLWLIKFCQQKGLNYRLGKCFNDTSRIKILEYKRLDTKTSMVLISYDNDEFLILLGATSNILLKQNSQKASKK